MALTTFTLVKYSGTDIGAIYLEDCGKRHQLGGAEQFVRGQDIVIKKGDVLALANSGPVITSSQFGILKTWSTANSEKVAGILTGNGALGTGGNVYRVKGLTGTQASLNGGVTGLSAPLTLIPSDGITGTVRSGVTGTKKTNPPTSVGDF